ncbi:MAG: single-stranded-DNA-specific exonuclease RecJ [Desulfobacteraceae bacterium]
MQTEWKYREVDEKTVELLGRELGSSNVLARCLAARGIETPEQAREFIRPNLQGLTDPFLILDMEKAVQRIASAMTNREKILVFGDFDADGVTATCLVNDFLTSLDADVSWYIPHRIKEGYGLQTEHIRMAVEQDVDLVITVDCGSSSHDAIKEAALEDIDVIVTDHHEISDGIPPAFACVNPKRKECPSGLDYLAGVGVAFYLIIALRKFMRENSFFEALPEPNLLEYCDLVALGTIGDMVPLLADNRVLCTTGINVMKKGSRKGLVTLSHVSRVELASVDCEDIAFRLIPRINAAGRISHARICVNQVSATTGNAHEKGAEILDGLNRKRQLIEQEILAEIEKKILETPYLAQQPAVILWDKKWNPSVLGIAASKLSRKYMKPAVLISTREEPAVGSCRSIAGVNIHKAITECSCFLERYGGHEMAAGITIKSEHLHLFEACINRHIEANYTEEDFKSILDVDCRLALSDISMELAEEVASMGPFGKSNPEPTFTCSDIQVVSSVIIGRHHRKMVISDSGPDSGAVVDAFQFNIQDTDNPPRRFSRIAFKLKINKFKKRAYQIIIQDTQI